MRLRLLLVVPVTWLAIASSVQAAETVVSFPGQQVSTRPLLVSARGFAIRYWAQRGVTGCPHGVTLYTATRLRGDDDNGRGLVGGCVIWLRRRDIHWMSWGYEPRWLARICALVTHETGHALGLAHTATGVMSPGGDGRDRMPWGCEGWAREQSVGHRRQRSNTAWRFGRLR